MSKCACDGTQQTKLIEKPMGKIENNYVSQCANILSAALDSVPYLRESGRYCLECITKVLYRVSALRRSLSFYIDCQQQTAARRSAKTSDPT